MPVVPPRRNKQIERTAMLAGQRSTRLGSIYNQRSGAGRGVGMSGGGRRNMNKAGGTAGGPGFGMGEGRGKGKYRLG